MDFLVVCDKVLPLVEKMIVDEARQHVLTNFIGGKSVESDHNNEILKLNMQYHEQKKERVEIFNFKNAQCQENFQF